MMETFIEHKKWDISGSKKIGTQREGRFWRILCFCPVFDERDIFLDDFLFITSKWEAKRNKTKSLHKCWHKYWHTCLQWWHCWTKAAALICQRVDSSPAYRRMKEVVQHTNQRTLKIAETKLLSHLFSQRHKKTRRSTESTVPNSKQNHAHLSESALTRHFILDRRHLPRCPDLSNVWHFRRNFSMKMLKPREVSISDSPRWQVAAGKQIQEMSFWRSGDKVDHQAPSNTIKHHQTPTLFLAYWTKASNFAKTCLSGSCPCPSKSLPVTYLHPSCCEWFSSHTVGCENPFRNPMERN